MLIKRWHNRVPFQLVVLILTHALHVYMSLLLAVCCLGHSAAEDAGLVIRTVLLDPHLYLNVCSGTDESEPLLFKGMQVSDHLESD